MSGGIAEAPWLEQMGVPCRHGDTPIAGWFVSWESYEHGWMTKGTMTGRKPPNHQRNLKTENRVTCVNTKRIIIAEYSRKQKMNNDGCAISGLPSGNRNMAMDNSNPEWENIG